MLDMVASKVTGLVSAKDCRVVWTNGHLYICRSPDNITVLACDEPKRSAGSWKVRVGDAAIRMVPPGCGSCRARVMASPVGRMTVEQIVAAASVGQEA